MPIKILLYDLQSIGLESTTTIQLVRIKGFLFAWAFLEAATAPDVRLEPFGLRVQVDYSTYLAQSLNRLEFRDAERRLRLFQRASSVAELARFGKILTPT